MIHVQKWLGKETTIKRQIVDGKMVVVSFQKIEFFRYSYLMHAFQVTQLLCILN